MGASMGWKISNQKIFCVAVHGIDHESKISGFSRYLKCHYFAHAPATTGVFRYVVTVVKPPRQVGEDPIAYGLVAGPQVKVEGSEMWRQMFHLAQSMHIQRIYFTVA